MNEPDSSSEIIHLGLHYPKGPKEALERATLLLGSFTSNHEPDPERSCECKQCVAQEILSTAAEFNALKINIEGAPRRKQVADNLRRLRDGARILADALVGLDDYSRDWLERPTRGHIYDSHNVKLFNAAYAMELPIPEKYGTPAMNGRLHERIEALEAYADVSLEQFRGWRDDDNPRKNKGGATNLMRERLGPPTLRLVKDCWRLFEAFKPGKATASENGTFVEFANTVYEYATGETDENSTVLGWTKRAARPLRKYYEQFAILRKLEAELAELNLNRQTQKRDGRIAKLEILVADQQAVVVKASLATNHRNLEGKSRN